MEGLLLTGDIVYLAPMGESEKQRKNIVWERTSESRAFYSCLRVSGPVCCRTEGTLTGLAVALPLAEHC